MNMKRSLPHASALLALIGCLVSSTSAVGQYAAAVESYDAGMNPVSGYTNTSAAIGQPERYTGEGVFPSIVSPFSPPYLTSEVVSIGEGGHLTLRLSHYALPMAGGPEIGVFTNVGLADVSWPNGEADDPAGAFGIGQAFVEASADGVIWQPLEASSITFDIPTNGFTDLADPYSTTPGTALSDFRLPFTGTLSSFDGLPYSDTGGPDILKLLGGSGGGTWLDISATGLTRIGYIRFSVFEDAGSELTFELDAVSIAHGALGGVVPEPATSAMAATLVVGTMLRSRRCSPLRRHD